MSVLIGCSEMFVEFILDKHIKLIDLDIPTVILNKEKKILFE